MSYRWAAASDVGRVRGGNEDSVYPSPGAGEALDPMVALVADGMGGAVGGEIASRLASVAAVAADGDAEARVTAANAAVIEQVIADPTLAGMGTTITIGIFEPGGKVQVGHVGDSRSYLISGGEMTQITTDHSLVAELLAAGRIKPGDVATHPQRHLVTRVLGMGQQVAVDLFDVALEPGDMVMFCSDGLTGMLTDAEIVAVLDQAESLEAGADALVDAANAAGGIDNISLVIVERTE